MKKLRRFIYKWVDRKFLGGCSSYNSLKTRKSCRSKKQARQVFQQHGIPHARGTVFYGFVQPVQFVKKYGFPVVVKPNVSGFSRGSYFPITSYAELLKALFLVKLWWPSSIIEQYLEGRNYRVVVVKDEIMSVIRRYPPFVIGDGKTTVSDLIDRENDIRKKMQLYPVIHPIEKTGAVLSHLKKQGKNLRTIPAAGEYTQLHNRISLAPGGVVEVLAKEDIHPDNKQLLMTILPLFGANILGIDVIFAKGIEYSYLQQQTIFLEVNSRPYLKMHDYPRYGEKEDLSRYYAMLDALTIDEQDVF